MIEIMSDALADSLLALPTLERTYAPGEFVFHQGDDVRIIHFVCEGTVNLVRYQTGGASLVLQRAAAGSVLAEASIFSARYHCAAIAIVASRTRSVKKSAVRSKLLRNPAFAEAWLGHLAREVQAARTRAEILSLRTVAERLDAWCAAREACLPEKGEWKALAAEIGTSPEALYRELAKRRG